MTTPWKTVESAFWTWLASRVSLPANLKTFPSYNGPALPFLDNPASFGDPTKMPAMWLRLAELHAEDADGNTYLEHTIYNGGLAWNNAANAPARDTFEALVYEIRHAILGRANKDVTGIATVALSKERISTFYPPRTWAPVLGYVWTFSLDLGVEAVHFPP